MRWFMSPGLSKSGSCNQTLVKPQNCLRTLARIQKIYSSMDQINDELSGLQTQGVIEGFHVMLGCKYAWWAQQKQAAHLYSMHAWCVVRIESRVQAGQEVARRLWLGSIVKSDKHAYYAVKKPKEHILDPAGWLSPGKLKAVEGLAHVHPGFQPP